MAILAFLIIFFGVFALINWFSLNSAISFSFIARFSLIFIMLAMAWLHIMSALAINELSENASETTRNLLFFAGIFELAFAIGLVFVRSVKWTSFAMIGFLVLLAILNVLDVLRDFSFAQIEDPIGYPLNLLEYFSIAIWVTTFGIIYRDKEGVLGLKGKGW